MKTAAILPAGSDDIGTVADLIAEAFAGLAAAAWLVPDPDRRQIVLRDNMRIHVEHALHHGDIDLLADHTGTAVWLHCDKPIPPPDDYERRLAIACGPYTDRFHTLDKLFEQHHPAEPHDHLHFLAVAPAWQRTGRGSALLRHHHSELPAGQPAYLEASSVGSRTLYSRHGYQLRQRFPLPDGTAFWPMWRTPRPVAAPH